MMVTPNSYGIAIRISDRNEYGLSPKNIVNIHFTFSCDTKGPVYFSTNNKQDSRFKERLEEVILFFKDGCDIKYVKAKIIKVLSQKDPFLPEDAEKFSPSIFASDSRRSWYLLDDFCVLNRNEVSNYFYRNNDNLQLEPLDLVLDRPRFPKCYYEFYSENKNLKNLFE
ncbi:hypothetical protein WKT02_11060 [Erysipelotrichaceae bacterium HCN-30851]